MSPVFVVAMNLVRDLLSGFDDWLRDLFDGIKRVTMGKVFDKLGATIGAGG